MDGDLQTILTTQLTNFGDDAIDLIGVILPLAFAVAVTLTLVVMGIRWFRRIAGV